MATARLSRTVDTVLHASLFAAGVVQVYLSSSFVWRAITAPDFFDPPPMRQMMLPWEAHAAWAPWAIVVLAWLTRQAIAVSRSNRALKQQFILENGDSPLARMAIRQRQLQQLGACRGPAIALFCVVVMAWQALFSDGGGLVFIPTVIAGVASACAIVALVICAALAGYGKFSQFAQSPDQPSALLRWLAGKTSPRLMFEQIPAEARADLIAQAQRLGVDPASAHFMRSATADYRRRAAKAARQAAHLQASTAQAPAMDAHQASAKRF